MPPSLSSGIDEPEVLQSASKGTRADSFSGTRVASGYFLVQGLAIFAWWGTLGALPEMRRLFLPEGASEVDLLAFLLPDLVLAARPAPCLRG